MSRNTVVRQELLGRLGLQESASDQEVEAAHNGLVDFLELAPHEVKSWAASQTADVDEAFALLSGPEADLVAAAAPLAAMAQSGPDGTFQARTAAPVAMARPAAPYTPKAPVAAKPRKNLYAGGIVAVIALVIFGVWYMGRDPGVPGISGKPTSSTTAAAQPSTPPLDQAKVGALMQKITANPKDLVSLAGLGDLYFASADYKNAEVFEQKVLTVDPKNQKGLLAIGAAQFNQGNAAAAKKNWLVAAGLYPKSQEVHYDLGFLYMSATPPDNANRDAEWKKVVAIDPTSNLAKTVATHIKTPTATATTK